jgi:hypothetical protein
MGLLTMWREARGRVLRAEYDDAVGRKRNGNGGYPTPEARRAFSNELRHVHENVQPRYDAASPRDRRRMKYEAKVGVRNLWRQGFWPQALGASVAMMNLESRHLPGADALYVRTATDLLLKERHSPEFTTPAAPRFRPEIFP